MRLTTIKAATFLVGTLFGLTAVASDYVESGFLPDYSLLQSDPERPNVRLYIAPGADLDHYDKVFLADVEIFLHPESEYHGISVKKLTEVSEQFQNYVQDNLVTKRELVSEIVPGDKTIVLKMAITNVFAKKPDKKVIDYTPIGLAKNGAKKLAGKHYALSTAALEGVLLNPENGETVGALVATQLGETLAKAKAEERTWEDIQASLREYADTLSQRF